MIVNVLENGVTTVDIIQDNLPNTVEVLQSPTPNVVEVITAGPIGPVGPSGSAGPPGSAVLSGGTNNFIPLWSGSTNLTSSIIRQASGTLQISGSTSITGSLNVTNGITGSLFGTASNSTSASYALNSTSASYAATASNILGGKATHLPFFITDTTLATSSIYQSGSTSVIINQDNNTTANPEALYVWQPHPTSINVISGKGNVNNYLQLNIQNTNQGTVASSDVVATADNGNETSNYIDMGINSENFSGPIGGPNDAYLYSAGQHLHIGNITPDKPIQFFVGGADSNVDRKFELNANGQHNMTGSLEISGSLKVNQGITGSLFGSASYSVSSSRAISSSYATTASYVLQAVSSSYTNNALSASYALTASYALNAGTTINTGSFVTTSSFNSFTSSYNTGSFTGSFTGTLTGTASLALNANSSLTSISASYATNTNNSLTATSASHAIQADNAATANYATTAGNGGVTNIIAGSGITLPFGGTGAVTIVAGGGGGGVTIISGSAVTSSFVNSSTWTFNHNLGIRTPTITVFDSDYNQIIPQNIQLVSTSSATITFPTLESGFAIASTGGTTGTALSSSYSLFATYADSASYYPETDPIFTAKSGSFATTGSNRFVGTQTITGSLIVSSSNSITVIGPMTITGSLLVSGSTTQIGNNNLVGNTSLSGSISISGSQTFKGNLGLTGSLNVSGSTLQTGNNTLIGNTVLSGSLGVSGSQVFKGDFDLTGSFTVTGSTVQIGNNTLTGNTSLTGSIVVSGSQTFIGNNTLTGSFSVTGSTIQVGNNTLFGNTTLTGSIAMSGSILIYGDVLPQISSSYSLGSSTNPWKGIYVQSGSINIQSDIPGNPDAVISNQTGNISIAAAGFQITSGSYTPFRVDPTGRTRLLVPNIPANDIGAFSIIGNESGSYQPVINPSGMVHVTGNDAQAARVTVDGFGTTIGAIYVGRHARGTAALPTPTLSGDVLVRFAGLGYATSSYFPVIGAVPTSLEFQATENYSTSSYGSRAAFYTYANGAVSRSLSATIDATGITIPSSSLLFGTASWALNTLTASYAPNYLLLINTGSFATTGSNTFRGNQTISGSITTSGSLTVNGPAIFNDQTVQITGSLQITGSGYINGLPILTSANTSSFTDGFGWYGAFCSTGSQTNPVANVSRSMQLDTVEHSNGVTLVSGSRITFSYAGVYNIQFSAQLQNTSAGDSPVNIWFKKNGSNVSRSNTVIELVKQAGNKTVAAWNYVDTANKNDYFEIIWQSSDTSAQLHAATATGNIPVTPSVIITATQVG